MADSADAAAEVAGGMVETATPAQERKAAQMVAVAVTVTAVAMMAEEAAATVVEATDAANMEEDSDCCKR